MACIVSGLLVSGAANPSEASGESASDAAGPWSFDLGLFSQYVSRGITYSHERPALQATAQYSHPSGWYGGLWLSSISRYSIHDGTLESDPFGGYAGSRGDWRYDVGFWRWTFIGASLPASKQKYDTVELYASIGWKSLSVRYWREVTDYFGLNSQSAQADFGLPPNGSSRGSGYLEGNALFELPGGFTLGMHLGRETVRNYSSLSFSEQRVSVDRSFGAGWFVDLAYSKTNADAALYRDAGGLDVARAKLIGYVKKTF